MEQSTYRVYNGSRGNDFKACLRSVLERASLKEKYIELLLSPEGMEIYNTAFTSSSADEENNYEVFEQLGDLSANKFINWYMYRRFPQLNCPQGVKVVARLRINYGSKQSFWKISQGLGFWDFITASEDERSSKMKPLLEDTLESFIGATEYFLDSKIRLGVGYAIVYDILASIFDCMPISLKYTDLYDEKTRLKELFDYFKNLGVLKYKETKIDMITTSTVYYIAGGQTVVIGQGSASLKTDAQKAAAAQGLRTLEKMGYEKPIPEIYAMFSRSETDRM